MGMPSAGAVLVVQFRIITRVNATLHVEDAVLLRCWRVELLHVFLAEWHLRAVAVRTFGEAFIEALFERFCLAAHGRDRLFNLFWR